MCFPAGCLHHYSPHPILQVQQGALQALPTAILAGAPHGQGGAVVQRHIGRQRQVGEALLDVMKGAATASCSKGGKQENIRILVTHA
jgi:hypothetical protein